MVDKLTVLWELLKGNVAKFLEIDFNSVRYENAGLAVWFGYALAAVVFAKIVLDIAVKKPARTDSGYVIKTRHKQGFAVRFGYFIPKLALLCVAVLAIRTLTGPFINEFRETEETIESRTIIFLVDGSSSMLEIFLGSKDKESKAEIGNKIVLDLLRSRLGKKDRASYWLFASNPYPVQGFTTNDQMFYIQVDDAPWAVSSCSKLPPGRCANVKDSSGTALNIALQRLIIYIDEDEGAGMASQIYLFIVSDAEVYGDPENELKSIQTRNVVPHLVFIAGKKFAGDDGQEGDSTQMSAKPPASFVRQIHRYGGKVFDVRDEDSIPRLSDEIENLETSLVRLKKYTWKVGLFQIFLSLVLVVTFFITIAALLMEKFWTTEP